MKHISWLIFLYFNFSLYSLGQKVDTSSDFKKMNLYGKIASLREVTYAAKGDLNKIKSTDINTTHPNCSYYFNGNGNIDSIVNYNTEGNTLVTETFSYNNKGFLDQRNEIDTNRKLISTQIIQYDNNGFKTKEIYKNTMGELILQKIYKYTITDSNTYSYSTTGLGKDNILLWEIIYRLKYSVDKNLIYRITEYPRNKATGSKVKFYYDSSNLVVRQTAEYVTQKKIISEQFIGYDNKKNISKLTETVPQNYIVYSYDFDNQDNWTKRIEKELVTDKTTGKIKERYTVTLREFKYY